ncbi:MAG: heme o synthase [Myxococcota bacterium]|nr:heme o synthase [Myxococcota bacterium]
MALPPSNAPAHDFAGRSLKPAVESLVAYLNLTKPRLLPMVLFTALPVLGLLPGGWPAPFFSILVIVGVALAAASANTFNAYIERESDARMERTRGRPLPAGEVSPIAALGLGWLLGISATVLLGLLGGFMAAAIAVASILFYVFVYTVWLKPRTAWNTVVGAAAGAVAPVLAQAAATGTVGALGLTLFAIVFFWQPPHVWAIALYRKPEYEAAGVMMLPTAIGSEATRRWMVAWTIGLFPVSLLPLFLGFVGPVYGVVAFAANAVFLASAVHVYRRRSDDAARLMFRVSLAYLFVVFLAINLEVVLRSL